MMAGEAGLRFVPQSSSSFVVVLVLDLEAGNGGGVSGVQRTRTKDEDD
jgi:hypothetical protein